MSCRISLWCRRDYYRQIQFSDTRLDARRSFETNTARPAGPNTSDPRMLDACYPYCKPDNRDDIINKPRRASAIGKMGPLSSRQDDIDCFEISCQPRESGSTQQPASQPSILCANTNELKTKTETETEGRVSLVLGLPSSCDAKMPAIN